MLLFFKFSTNSVYRRFTVFTVFYQFLAGKYKLDLSQVLSDRQREERATSKPSIDFLPKKKMAKIERTKEKYRSKRNMGWGEKMVVRSITER